MYTVQSFGPNGPIGEGHNSDEVATYVDALTWCIRYVSSMLQYDWVSHVVVKYPGGACIVKPKRNRHG